MISYEDARARILEGVGVLPLETLPLSQVHGRVLAEPLIARLTQPPFPASAMDGYALKWADIPGPWHIVGESAAGKAYHGTVGAGHAVRIFTGAPVPEGADTVIVQEDMTQYGSDVRLTGYGPPRQGAHIRPSGNDFHAQDVLLSGGTIVTAAAIGLAAAAGHDSLPVVRKPRIAIIATGDELVPPGTAPGPAQIVAGNGPMLAALLGSKGADVDDLGIIADDEPRIANALKAAAEYDIILTIGGASVGDHDLVKEALSNAGATLDFWRIAIKPGKPLIAGRLGDARLIGLPGNPVSAYVCALLFALPMLRAMQGHKDQNALLMAKLSRPLPANSDRRDHLRAVLEEGVATPLDMQDSAQLAVLAKANALIVRPPDAVAAEIGDTVPVLTLDRT
ncbi:MAG: gephyrin-like molybdotransferase Glp [Pacificimonas sp.]